MQNKDYLTYAESGVSINANDVMVDRIATAVKRTHGPRVINIHNAFAGLFRLDYDEKLFRKNYKNPVLTACTDGVGTKVLIARQMKKYHSVGIDLVAMSVNDMIVQGAEPLFFLDYLGVNKLEPALVAEMVGGIARGCQLAGCALIGGETAEMPDIYSKKNEFDMAGFAVGVVEKDRLITGKTVQNGDVVLGLASSGLHSNGFSLARNICFKKLKLRTTDCIDELSGQAIGDVLLEPTRIYVKSVVSLLGKYKVKKIVHGMAHITGGGIEGNVVRSLPCDVNAVIDTKTWEVPDIFSFLQKNGPVEEKEMYKVLNMGIGYVLIVAADFVNSVSRRLTKLGEKVYPIGKITKGSGKVILKH